MFTKSETKANRPRDGRHCDLCGCSCPAVRCDKCGSQIFCLSCDDMYHRHPKRKFHLRKAVDPTPNQQARPMLPLKVSSLTNVPGDPSKMPLPPPRKKKPGKSIFDSFRRASPSGEPSNPYLPKKEYSWSDRLGSITKFMSNRPLPPVPDNPADENDNVQPTSSPPSNHSLSFIHKRVEEKPPALPQRQPRSPQFEEQVNGDNNVSNGAVNAINGNEPNVASVNLPRMQPNQAWSMNPPFANQNEVLGFGTIRRQIQPQDRRMNSPTSSGMAQSSSASDLTSLSDVSSIPHMQQFPPYVYNPNLPPAYPYPMYPQYPPYPQYFGNSWANLATPPPAADGDFSDQSEVPQRKSNRGKYKNQIDKKAKRSQSVLVDRMAYPGHFYPFGPFPSGYPGPPWMTGHSMEPPSSPSVSMRSLSRLSQSQRKKATDDDDDDYYSSSPVSRPKSSSSEISKNRALAKMKSCPSSSSEEELNVKSKANSSSQRRFAKPHNLKKRTSSPRRPSLTNERKITDKEVEPDGDEPASESPRTTEVQQAKNQSDLSIPAKQNEITEAGTSRVTSDSPWQCKHCTYINPANQRICQVCCKTIDTSNSPVASEVKMSELAITDNTTSEVSQLRQEAGSHNSDRDRQDIANLSTALDEAEKQINQSLEELLKVKEESTTVETSTSQQQAGYGQSPSRTQFTTAAAGNSDIRRYPVNNTSETASTVPPYKTALQNVADALNQNSVRVGEGNVNFTQYPGNPRPLKEREPPPPQEVNPETRKDSFCQTYQDVPHEEHSSFPPVRSMPFQGGRGGQRLYERGDVASPTGPYNAYQASIQQDRAHSGNYNLMHRGHSMASLFVSNTKDSSSMEYGGMNLGVGPSSMVRSLSRASLLGDNEGWADYPVRLKPDFYLSMEELVERRRQDTMRAQGLELVRMIREAEQQGFTADDIQVALNNCGKQNPLNWLQENWKNVIRTVVTLATNYGKDKRENDVGVLSENEAKDALRLHKGNIWAAVTECVEGRQRKFLELSARGNFTFKEIIDALTNSGGNVEMAYAKLTNTTLKPFLMRIYGSGEGVPNLEGVSPDTFALIHDDQYLQLDKSHEQMINGKGSDDEVWDDESYENDEDWENEEQDVENIDCRELSIERSSPEVADDLDRSEKFHTLTRDNTLDNMLSLGSDKSDYCDAFGTGLGDRYLSSTSIDEIYLIDEEVDVDELRLDHKEYQRKRAPSFLNKLAALRKTTGTSKMTENEMTPNDKAGEPIHDAPLINDANYLSGEESDNTRSSFNPINILKQTFTALKETVTGKDSKGDKNSISIYDKRTIVVNTPEILTPAKLLTEEEYAARNDETSVNAIDLEAKPEKISCENKSKGPVNGCKPTKKSGNHEASIGNLETLIGSESEISRTEIAGNAIVSDKQPNHELIKDAYNDNLSDTRIDASPLPHVVTIPNEPYTKSTNNLVTKSSIQHVNQNILMECSSDSKDIISTNHHLLKMSDTPTVCNSFQSDKLSNSPTTKSLKQEPFEVVDIKEGSENFRGNDINCANLEKTVKKGTIEKETDDASQSKPTTKTNNVVSVSEEKITQIAPLICKPFEESVELSNSKKNINQRIENDGSSDDGKKILKPGLDKMNAMTAVISDKNNQTLQSNKILFDRNIEENTTQSCKTSNETIQETSSVLSSEIVPEPQGIEESHNFEVIKDDATIAENITSEQIDNIENLETLDKNETDADVFNDINNMSITKDKNIEETIKDDKTLDIMVEEVEGFKSIPTIAQADNANADNGLSADIDYDASSKTLSTENSVINTNKTEKNNLEENVNHDESFQLQSEKSIVSEVTDDKEHVEITTLGESSSEILKEIVHETITDLSINVDSTVKVLPTDIARKIPVEDHVDKLSESNACVKSPVIEKNVQPTPGISHSTDESLKLVTLDNTELQKISDSAKTLDSKGHTVEEDSISHSTSRDTIEVGAVKSDERDSISDSTETTVIDITTETETKISQETADSDTIEDSTVKFNKEASILNSSTKIVIETITETKTEAAEKNSTIQLSEIAAETNQIQVLPETSISGFTETDSSKEDRLLLIQDATLKVVEGQKLSENSSTNIDEKQKLRDSDLTLKRERVPDTTKLVRKSSISRSIQERMSQFNKFDTVNKSTMQETYKTFRRRTSDAEITKPSVENSIDSSSNVPKEKIKQTNSNEANKESLTGSSTVNEINVNHAGETGHDISMLNETALTEQKSVVDSIQLNIEQISEPIPLTDQNQDKQLPEYFTYDAPSLSSTDISVNASLPTEILLEIDKENTVIINTENASSSVDNSEDLSGAENFTFGKAEEVDERLPEPNISQEDVEFELNEQIVEIDNQSEDAGEQDISIKNHSEDSLIDKSLVPDSLEIDNKNLESIDVRSTSEKITATSSNEVDDNSQDEYSISAEAEDDKIDSDDGLDLSHSSASSVRPIGHLRRMSFNTRKVAIFQERHKISSSPPTEEKPWFLQKKVEVYKPALPKRSIKQQLEFERKVRLLVSERKCRTYRKAEIVMQLMELKFEETEAIYAANECANLDQAVSFLQQECQLCAGKYPIGEMISMIHCSHKACAECLKAYFTIQIRDRTIMELLCPFCNEPDITDEDVAQDYFNHLDIMLKKLMDDNIHELFQRKLLDRVLMKDPNFRWCSQCSSGFITDPYLKRLVCPDCRAVTCASCRRLWEREHEGVTCEVFASWKDEHDPETQTAGLAKLLTEDGIDCPSCHFRYALAKGGCMHFKCIQCHHDFCSGCSRPFKMGKKCGVSEFCAKLGLHAHHPRNCLFYLRDKDPEDLQRLLDMNDVYYDKDRHRSSEGQRVCDVMEQKETSQGMVDDICGKDVQFGYAGLCRLHYVEYLGQLVNRNKVDPIQIFDNDDLELVLKRASIRLPPKRYGESAEQYRDKLVELIEEKLPLGEHDGS